MKVHCNIAAKVEQNTATHLKPGAPVTHDEKQIGRVTDLRFENGNLIAEMEISDNEFATIVAKTKSHR